MKELGKRARMRKPDPEVEDVKSIVTLVEESRIKASSLLAIKKKVGQKTLIELIEDTRSGIPAQSELKSKVRNIQFNISQ